MKAGAFQWWALLFGLGAFHGVNPAMGWLFAVARGMQEESRPAAWWAMVPLTLGHFLAIGAAIAVAVIAGDIVPLAVLRWPVGVVLIGLGGYQLVRHRHPRYRGMRVGTWGLLVWSFLMASIHGAGLMVIPLFLGPSNLALAAMATLVHGAGYALVTAFLAGLFYEKIGVGVLRRAWINVNLVWALALILIGAVTLSV